MVDGQFYDTVNISDENKNLTEEQIKNGKQRYVCAPYVLQQVDKPNKEYVKFMKKYRKAHAACPKCGSEKHIVTLMGYSLYLDKKGDYKDLNNCSCSNCGYSCTMHELVSKKEFKKTKDEGS